MLVVVHVAVVRQALVAMLLLPLGAVLGHVRTLEVLALVLVVRATVALAALLVDVLAVLLRGVGTDHISLRGCALDLLVALLGLLLFVALGVLGRADLAAPGVDARATLSFALDYFAGRFGRHIYY